MREMRNDVTSTRVCSGVPRLTGGRLYDFWLDHSRVDPRTKLYCCGENDCHLLPVSQAHATKGGYLLDDTSETISWDRVQPSPDGGIWACRWGGETKCFFAPIPGA